ncbi:glycerol-3-phosphate dehydrogenase [Trichonephila clavata]|uniref:Glycerol-3-phosphate dehydrogenase n=1 Tax=Trichonephila clavata TaxID=2740835 RepID=A0A8X6LY94_TRICU|nr:glycerol-3-phosphate dehydrogenase [Trichonephila clavata]
MSILRRLLGINSNTPEVKEVIGFNPTNVELIEGNGVAYGLSYQDNGNGSSKVKLLISPLYQSKTYECGTNISVANEFKDQLSLTLIEDSAEIDKVGIIFPEEGISEEGEKYVKGLSFHTYGIKQSINVPSVEHLDKRKLQKNINNGSPANVGNSYFQPRAAKVDNGDVIVIAHNLKDQTLVSWYLKLGKSGKFKVLDGKQGFTERKLFKFGNPGQLVLNGNTMLYSQVSKRITKENQEVRKTRIFKFDMAKVVEDLKSGKKDECLLGKKNCQINTASSITSNPGEINFLQYVEGGNLVAFLAEGRSPNKQTLHLTSLVKNGSKSNFTVCEFADSIKQLYVKNNGQDSFIVTAINEGNITICNHQRFEKPSKVTIIPANSIKTFSDFVNIINGQLTPDIISSSTVVPIETVVTSKQASTAAIASTAETDTVKTTKLTTEAIASTSTMDKPSTGSTIQTSTVTVEPTTAAKTTTTSQATTITATSTSVPSETETSTVKPTAATVASTSTMSKPSTESTTQTSTVTMEPTVPTTSSEKTTQTVFIIPSTRTRESTTPIFTTTLLPQTTSSPQPTQLAIGSNRAGVIGGSLVGAIISIAGIIGFMAYKYVKGRNAAPVLELTDFNDRRRSSSSGNSDEEIFVASNRMSSYGSGTVLNSISVENSSRSRSSSSSSGSGPSS